MSGNGNAAKLLTDKKADSRQDCAYKGIDVLKSLTEQIKTATSTSDNEHLFGRWGAEQIIESEEQLGGRVRV